MKKRVVLSIYIATYNRKEILLEKIEKILKIKSDKFNIYVMDDASNDGTVDSLKEINDERLHIILNKSRMGLQKDGVMQNWYRLLEACDGLFAFHLNDRDYIDPDGIKELLVFLEDNPTMNGGVCDIRLGKKYKILYTVKSSFMKIPYFARHPTGIIFNMNVYHTIKERQSLFTTEKANIHPHDLILARISENGKMFRFYKIWNYPDTESFRNNRSFLYKKGTMRNAWFSPYERVKEFSLFVRDITKKSFSNNLKNKKVKQIAFQYLFYCTFNYSFYVSDQGQTAHYGIDPMLLSCDDLIKIRNWYILNSYRVFIYNKLRVNKLMYSFEIKILFWIIYYAKPVWDKIKKLHFIK